MTGMSCVLVDPSFGGGLLFGKTANVLSFGARPAKLTASNLD
jgi:hypothetical protein